MSIFTIEPKKSSRDYSGISILAGNAVTIVLAVAQKWDLGPLLIIYWTQSVTIGVFHFFRMLKLRQFSTEGFTSNGRPVPENKSGKRSTAIFFAIHFGFFHFVYAIFLFVGMFASTPGNPDPVVPGRLDWLWIVIGVISFIFSHAFSFVSNVEEDTKYRPNLGTMMFLPYLRIIPMHITIIAGGAIMAGKEGRSTILLLMFLLLKTGADYLFHIVEHRVLRKNKVQT